jgi:transposase
MMRFYDQQHRFYAGIDLHSSTMHLCVLDSAGKTVSDINLPTRPSSFLEAIAPFRDDVVVAAECMFTWYWLSDLCSDEDIPFVLGHAFYIKAIHQAKTKNDRLDAAKIARLLRGGNFPLAYAYPRGMRETRDLLRRRIYLVRQRSALFTHLQILNAQCNLPRFPKKLSSSANRLEMRVVDRFQDVSIKMNASADLAVIDCLDEQIDQLETYLSKSAKVDDLQTYHRLQTIPGVGKILALVLLYEIHDIKRFDNVGRFLSYSRLVRCTHESGGKILGSGGHKIGNPHLRWAFAEAATVLLRVSERARAWKQKQTKKRGEGKAMGILAAKLGRAVYQMWRSKEVFDESRFWQGSMVAVEA